MKCRLRILSFLWMIVCCLYCFSTISAADANKGVRCTVEAEEIVTRYTPANNGAGPNGGSLSKISCFSAIFEALSPGLPKLLMSTVCCVYSDDSDTRKFIQVRFPDRGLCLRKSP